MLGGMISVLQMEEIKEREKRIEDGKKVPSLLAFLTALFTPAEPIVAGHYDGGGGRKRKSVNRKRNSRRRTGRKH